ncbi:MAG: MinD/ParA family protein [Nocardiaceae bacterium]|nr:MinD/ParA family protein [Nocardiaceae bacterium]
MSGESALTSVPPAATPRRYSAPPRYGMARQQPSIPEPPPPAPPRVPDPSETSLSPAKQGWRRAARAATAGLVKFGASASEKDVHDLVQRTRAPLSGHFNLAVLSLKGGVGKTTTTIGLGSVLASLRTDRVIAIDANPDLGTLASRVSKETNANVQTLLAAPRVETYDDVRRHTSKAASGLEVLASDRDLAASEAYSDADYRRTVDILRPHYGIMLTDCGTGLLHSSMQGILGLADALMIISSPAWDGAGSAIATLDWLSQNGYHHLVRNSIVVISMPRSGSEPVDTKLVAKTFQGRVQSVHIIPYDEHLAIGAEVDLNTLGRKTRMALLELAAEVTDAFPQ